MLALREDLVRHDENWAAWLLLSECVPYFVKHDPAIAAARNDQRLMVRHLLEPGQMAEYYANNPHERPFEAQYGITVEESHIIPRVQWLLDHLRESESPALKVLDLSANDGWMAARLAEDGFECDCLDLNPANVERARRRGVRAEVGDLMHVPPVFVSRTYTDVVLFETIEHVADPIEALRAGARMVRQGGFLHVSTPNGAVEYGNVPEWDLVELKGHVRAVTAEDLTAWFQIIDAILAPIELARDNTLLARAQIL